MHVGVLAVLASSSRCASTGVTHRSQTDTRTHSRRSGRSSPRQAPTRLESRVSRGDCRSAEVERHGTRPLQTPPSCPSMTIVQRNPRPPDALTPVPDSRDRAPYTIDRQGPQERELWSANSTPQNAISHRTAEPNTGGSEIAHAYAHSATDGLCQGGGHTWGIRI